MLLDFASLKDRFSMEIKGVIHIGAHQGGEHSLFENSSASNFIFFEPLSENFKVLKEKVKDSRATFVNKALGSSCGNMKMFVEHDNEAQSSSLLKPKLHTLQYPHIKFTDEEEVSVSTLDKEIADASVYNCIIIDVQGYEIEVFKGARNTLPSIDYIISEVNREELYENCAQIDGVDAFLLDYGFERAATSWEGGTWGDALYVKKQP